KSRDQRGQVVGAVGRLQLGQGAQRQAQPVLAPVQNGGDLAAVPVDQHLTVPPRHASAVKTTAPADSSAISNVTSPSWLPEYSSEVIWNGPRIVPKLGTTSCQSTIEPAKKRARIAAS